ncbi:MAG: response regulator transcription factor [Chloroflexota bacterium]
MTLRFLIVDDHAPSRSILREMVATHDNWLVVGDADNGQAAVSLAATHHPDVILMDIAMPHLNGIQAARQIKAATPESRIILFSAYSNQGFRLASQEAGADFFIQKEKLTAQVLQEIVPQILAQKE